MNAQQFDNLIRNSLGVAFTEGVGKGKMTALDVAGILSNHTTGVLQLINETAMKSAQADKKAKEFLLQIDLNKNKG
jgi:hypothetical protein